jgi:hypothetical protein
MFSGCCGITAKNNAETHSLTHIAKLSDVRADISLIPGENLSQVGGGISVAEFLAISRKRESKAATKSTISNKSKNWHKDAECDLCGKQMREDALKNHRGKKFCKAK